MRRRAQQLDAAFQRVAGLQPDAEVLSDFARYLCVLVSGYLEQSVIELAMEHVRLHSHASVQRHVERRLRRFTTANAERIIQLMGSFDPDWQRDLEAYLIDARKDAVDGVIALRHAISHGRSADLTYIRVKEYYTRIKDVVNHIADLCVPPQGS